MQLTFSLWQALKVTTKGITAFTTFAYEMSCYGLLADLPDNGEYAPADLAP
jgi:hypothetical protein